MTSRTDDGRAVAFKQLTLEERRTIAIGRQQGLSMRAIARMLARPVSCVSREIARNTGAGDYSCHHAHQRAQRRRRFARAHPKLHGNSPLWQEVCRRLRLLHSPQQIAAGLRLDYPQQPQWHVSHETIYNCIFAQPRGALKKELIACLRMARSTRWPRSKGKDRRGQIADLLSIHVRPPEVSDRQLPGHWEGDLIKGARNQSAIGTLVERTSRLVLLVRLPHPNPATAAHVLQAFTDKLNAIAQPMRRSLTYDRGQEMALHAQLTTNTGMKVYFCDPHSPWQRGSNENTNGLLRQYLPKGTDLSGYTQEQLDAIADSLNNRPRMTLGWRTPLEVYSQWLHQLSHDTGLSVVQ